MRLIQTLAIFLAVNTPWITAAPRTSPLIIDHTYPFEQVPDATWEEVRNANPTIHLSNRSDGSAIGFGLGALRDMDAVAWPYVGEWTDLPPAGKGLGIWEGMEVESYVTPDRYWTNQDARDELTRILNSNPRIHYTSWTWCDEDDYWPLGPSQNDNRSLEDYFRIMDSLEQVFPQVTFIYQTAAMRDPGTDGMKIHQAEFNDSLRAWAIKNNKVLFDFADLDVWHAGDKHTTTVNGTTIPFQHPAWLENNGATTGWHHANDSMGIDKGKAWWTMMAMLETGWTPNPSSSLTPRQSRMAPRGISRIPFDLLGRTRK